MQNLQDFLRWAATLPPLAKGLVSLIVVALCAFIIVALWANPTSSGASPADMWPMNKSMDGLRRRLDVISRENAKFLVEIASADQYGLYIGEVAQRLNISRAEADARSKDLQAQGLLDLLALTDVNIRLNKDLRTLLSPDPRVFLSSYLKQKPVGHRASASRPGP